MTPPEEIRNEFLQRWLLKAEEDLGLAKYLLETQRTYHNSIGFHAQQAAEKYLKAYLVSVQVDFPKTHSIERLLAIVSFSDNRLSDSLKAAFVLSDYGVEVRYPGELPELSLEQAQTAVALAEKVRDAVIDALKNNIG